jgi:energy-coupling factor transporter transmembrane protein EcfT
MTHPTIFLYVCLSFILGIFFGSFLYSFYLIFVLIIFSLFIVGILWKKKNVLILFVFFFLLGYVYVNSFAYSSFNTRYLMPKKG